MSAARGLGFLIGRFAKGVKWTCKRPEPADPQDLTRRAVCRSFALRLDREDIIDQLRAVKHPPKERP